MAEAEAGAMAEVEVRAMAEQGGHTEVSEERSGAAEQERGQVATADQDRGQMPGEEVVEAGVLAVEQVRVGFDVATPVEMPRDAVAEDDAVPTPPAVADGGAVVPTIQAQNAPSSVEEDSVGLHGVSRAVPIVIPLAKMAMAAAAATDALDDLNLSETDLVTIDRGLVRDVLRDGTCPLHVRVRLEKVLRKPASQTSCDRCGNETAVVGGQSISSSSLKRERTAAATATPIDGHTVESGAHRALGSSASSSSSACAGKGDGNDGEIVPPSSAELPADSLFQEAFGCGCLSTVMSALSLREVLSFRASGALCLAWAMQRDVSGHPELAKVHNRIRARLWIQRVADLTKDTADETIFESQVKSYADDALRRRMEAEMLEAKVLMETQIHEFQDEVDRRMEEQALRVHASVEERVQQQLDTILAAEMEKVRALVEERVQERVKAVVQREVRATVSEVQVQLAALARENNLLRNAYVEHSDLCFRSLVWAVSPKSTGFFAQSLRLFWCCQRRFTGIFGQPSQGGNGGIPPRDRRNERLRSRVDALRRGLGGNDEQSMAELRSLWGAELEEERRLLSSSNPVEEMLGPPTSTAPTGQVQTDSVQNHPAQPSPRWGDSVSDAASAAAASAAAAAVTAAAGSLSPHSRALATATAPLLPLLAVQPTGLPAQIPPPHGEMAAAATADGHHDGASGVGDYGNPAAAAAAAAATVATASSAAGPGTSLDEASQEESGVATVAPLAVDASLSGATEQACGACASSIGGSSDSATHGASSNGSVGSANETLPSTAAIVQTSSHSNPVEVFVDKEDSAKLASSDQAFLDDDEEDKTPSRLGLSKPPDTDDEYEDDEDDSVEQQQFDEKEAQ
eukprot:TRINITY_DN25003_c0_g1_i1.p1 TRINITY_DN25003_c0_g1~~TRINITY_DN25003_c0_g1_i1.p1  ORF type:complete len:927 (+),score=189.16 TRINITY_DN25003_c0_g1_i1:208-2781(+)